LRRVVLDVDRRLRRIDPGTVELAAFHCSAERLAGAFKSGRPELSRTGLMRTIERRQQSATPAPPASFVGSPPRGGIPIVAQDTLVGSGVSAGVVEGPARIVTGILPDRVAPGDILVVNTFDAALTPLCAIARGVVAETGGALSMSASGLRSLSIPAVFGAPNAPLQLSDGELIRVDGTRGTVQRLAGASRGGDASQPSVTGND